MGNKIDYLSIDLEGIDYDVLMNIDLSRNTIENTIEINKHQQNEKQTKKSSKSFLYTSFFYCFIKKHKARIEKCHERIQYNQN